MSDATRRSFLRKTAANAVGLLGAAAVTGVVGRAVADHWREQPEHVTLSHNTSTLNRYQPKLVVNQEDREKLIAQYAWTASSPERDTDCHVYWTSYTHQDGTTGYDSHKGDHEPIYVFTDSETGDVETVLASIYHWIRGTATPSAIRMDDDRPVLRVMTPWHHYTAAASDADTHDAALEDLEPAFDDWLANGLEEDLEPGVVVNPWQMRTRSSWWRDTVMDFSVAEAAVQARRTLGIHKAGELA